MQFNHGLTKHPEIALEIANIICDWNLIEDITVRLLERFYPTIKMGGARQLLSAVQSAQAKVKFVKKAGQQFFDDKQMLNEFIDVMDKVEKAISHRNRYAHALYGIDENNILHRVVQSEDPRSSKKYVRIDLQELRNHVATFSETFNAVIRLHEKLGDMWVRELQASLGTFSTPDLGG